MSPWGRVMKLHWASGIVVVGALLMGGTALVPSALATDCIYQCESNEIQFLPGQSIKIEIVNHTRGRVELERVLDFDPYVMRPGQTISLNTLVGYGPDMSIVFWDENYLPIKVALHRPEANTLRIEFLPSGNYSDQAVHLVNDGRVLIY
jgi:hypothetical protein